MSFKDSEIKEELANCGFSNLSTEQFEEFKRQLFALIDSEKRKEGIEIVTLNEDAQTLNNRSPEVGCSLPSYEMPNTRDDLVGNKSLEKSPINNKQNSLGMLEQSKLRIQTDPQIGRNTSSIQTPVVHKNTSLNNSVSDQSLNVEFFVNESLSHDKKPSFQHVYRDRQYKPKDEPTTVCDFKELNRSNSRQTDETPSNKKDKNSVEERCNYSWYSSFYEMPQKNEGNSKSDFKRKTCEQLSSSIKRIDGSLPEASFGGAIKVYSMLKSSQECRQITSTRPKDVKSCVSKKKIKKSGSILVVPPHERYREYQPTIGQMLKVYKKSWDAHTCPGVDLRESVRDEIHDKLMKKFEPKKESKWMIPNSCKIPGEKNRRQLISAIKLAHKMYEMPEHGFYHPILEDTSKRTTELYW